MKNKKFVVILLILVFVTSLTANISAAEMSLEEAIKNFVENSSQLENARRDTKTSEIDVETTKRDWRQKLLYSLHIQDWGKRL
jgi:competence protein ComGC